MFTFFNLVKKEKVRVEKYFSTEPHSFHNIFLMAMSEDSRLVQLESPRGDLHGGIDYVALKTIEGRQ